MGNMLCKETPSKSNVADVDGSVIQSVRAALDKGYYTSILHILISKVIFDSYHQNKKHFWVRKMNAKGKQVWSKYTEEMASVGSEYFYPDTTLELSSEQNNFVKLVLHYISSNVYKARFYFSLNIPIIQASIDGHIEIVREMLTGNVDGDCRDTFKRYAFLAAACEGHTDIVRILLEAQPYISYKEIDSKTSLMLATMNGHKQTVQFLIQHGINRRLSGDILNSALHVAVSARQPEIVCVLLQAKCNPNCLIENEGIGTKSPRDMDKMAKTPLMKACLLGNIEIVEILLRYNCDINDESDETALLCALHTYHSKRDTRNAGDIIALKLIESGAQVNCHRGCDASELQSCTKPTPLAWAINNSTAEIVNALLLHGSDPNHLAGLETPLTLAIMHKYNAEMAMVLLKYGASIHKTISAISNFDRFDRNFLKKYLVLIYLAGIGYDLLVPGNVIRDEQQIAQFILDEEETLHLLPLTNLCRRQIRLHLMNPAGGNQANLILAIPQLPLPQRLKLFLFYMESVDEIPTEIVHFIESLI